MQLFLLAVDTPEGDLIVALLSCDGPDRRSSGDWLSPALCSHRYKVVVYGARIFENLF